MKMYGGAEVYLHTFVTSALHGHECQFHVLVTLLPGKELLVHIGEEAGWVPELFWISDPAGS
jgi:hypothetical protein